MSRVEGLRKRRRTTFAKMVLVETKRDRFRSDIPFMSPCYQLEEENQSEVPEEVYKTVRKLQLENV